MVATPEDKDFHFSDFRGNLNCSISKMATTLSIQILFYNFMDIQDCAPYKMAATAVDTDAVFSFQGHSGLRRLQDGAN